MNSSILKIFNGARVDDRQVSELIGVAHGIIADGAVNEAEARYLYKWLCANRVLGSNPVVGMIYERMQAIMLDSKLDPDESIDLLNTLSELCGNEFEEGEALKSSTLPLCNPAPRIVFNGSTFCLTGTFSHGTRSACEAAVSKLGGIAGPLNKSTKYLVIGSYATDSWSQSSFGRKIEKAASMRSDGVPISIVSEIHWAKGMSDSAL